jgi:hypothetical protein
VTVSPTWLRRVVGDERMEADGALIEQRLASVRAVTAQKPTDVGQPQWAPNVGLQAVAISDAGPGRPVESVRHNVPSMDDFHSAPSRIPFRGTTNNV